MERKLKRLIISAAIAVGLSVPAMATDLNLARFFGDCQNAGTDTAKSVGEACIIQSIINAAGAKIDGVKITTLPTNWGNYYDQIKASYAAGTPPDIHVLHGSHLAEFTSVNALADLTDDLASAGIDVKDWEPKARDAVTYNGRIYGVPMDFHAELFHVNMDLMTKAGLVKDGKPILPTSPEEMLDQARKFKAATGKDYFAAELGSGMMGVRIALGWIWQQGGNVFDGTKATVNTPEAKKALNLLVSLIHEKLVRGDLNYADAEQAFLKGDVGILVNGTWPVDSYTAQAAKSDSAIKNYFVADFPKIFASGATWADNHMWAIPATVKAKTPDKYAAALKVLAFINDHDGDWARTGHMSVRTSILQSKAYASLPHRNEYVATASNAHGIPSSVKNGAIQDVLQREFTATWLTGKSVDAALTDANAEVQDLLN